MVKTTEQREQKLHLFPKFFLICFISFVFIGFVKADLGIPREPKLIWQLNIKDFKEKEIDPRGINRPILYNNKVFISASEVVALDLKTGDFLWRHKESNLYPSNIAAGEGKVFAVFNDSALLKNMSQGFIYAFDEQTGNFLWKYQTLKPISHSAPLFETDKVFLGDDSGTLYALDSKTGKFVWKKFLDAEAIHSSPAFYKGMIFVGTEGTGNSNALPSHLFALDAETGNIVWKFKVDFISGKLNLVHGAPAILDGVVYFGSENGYFYALAYNSGKLIWKKKITSGDKFLGGISAPPALSEEKVFITTWESKLFSLNRKDGEIAWQKTFDKSGRRGGDAATIAGNGLVCITVNERFSCLNDKNGEIVWNKNFFGGTPAAASGFLVISNTDIADGSPDNAAVIFAFSDAESINLPQASQADYNKNSGQKADLLFVAITIVGIGFLASLAFLIFKLIKSHSVKN